MVFTSSSTEVSSITGLKGEPPPLLTASTISATKTKRVAWYQSSQGNVKESLREKEKNNKKESAWERIRSLGVKISIGTRDCYRTCVKRQCREIFRDVAITQNWSARMQSCETTFIHGSLSVEWFALTSDSDVRLARGTFSFVRLPAYFTTVHVSFQRAASYKFSVNRLIFSDNIVSIDLL